jgi:L-2-amino-thiazoline-4-carboxylic acid hydrolase
MEHPLTYRDRFECEFASHFIPFLKILEKEIGHEKVIQSLRELAFQEAKEIAEQMVKTRGKNDLSFFKEIYNPSDPDLKDILTMEVLEDTEHTYVVNVTECLWAEIFRNAGAADFGFAAVCSDAVFTRSVNPQMGFELEGTIMQGKSCCLHRYFVPS